MLIEIQSKLVNFIVIQFDSINIFREPDSPISAVAVNHIGYFILTNPPEKG